MKRRRRIILQLTSLLDLLLMVIFAQYIGLQEASRLLVRNEQAKRRQAEQAQADTEVARGEAFDKLRELASALSISEQRRGDQSAKLQELATENLLLREKAGVIEQIEQARRKAAQDLQAVGELARDSLDVNAEAVRLALADVPPDDLARLLAELRQLKDKGPTEIIQYLREAAELRKRADIWEVHVAADDSIRIRVKDRVLAEAIFVTSQDDFLKQVLPLLRRQEEPKSLVVILVSWSDARLDTRSHVLAGVGQIVQVLDAQWKKAKRIETAVMGFAKELP
ncbi:MAG: hypothetical protein BWX88_04562 [Planctomycetes bacterium ADurb.Bin126]|nr:MAG: hypothetical protein BWX88_04562 [Planctomycetes bacterium ADurb.Bin126]HOD83441.1 hypothetical protein [Phycisphaerae bacterium]HQL76272.1 hypothetical protein [Phycisphaerae bacterium]